MSLSKADDVLTFWFEDSGPADWFKKDDDFDRLISTRFGGLVQRAGDGKQDHWMDTPRSCLALVLVLDQFPRNMFRGSSRAFATDEKPAKWRGAVLHSAMIGDMTKMSAPFSTCRLNIPN